jgi:GMP synthase (glutamine-hydrolysing)
MTKEIILILDFGSPYTKLIAQRIRENHVFSHTVPYNISAKEIKLLRPKGIILSGRIPSDHNKKIPPSPERGIFKLNTPILGIGYGAKVITQFFGGRMKCAKLPEFQRCELFIDNTHNLFWQMPSNITCWMNSTDFIKKLPKGFKKTAHTQDNPIAAMECSSQKIFGTIFHPEVVATQRGSQILSNFLYKICGCVGAWTMNSFIRETTSNIKKTVGKSKVLLKLTPTIDSFVTLLLVNKAIGKRLKCILIDSGLLRKDESKQIRKMFIHHFNLNVKYLDRSQRFLQALKNVTKADEKRRMINNLSIKIFQEEIKKTKGAAFLARGTLYPEAAKSISGNGPFKLKPLEPLRDLFEDEVKVVAKHLGLPDSIILKQPFPEAGLAVRILGEVTLPRLRILREAEAYLLEEIKEAGIYEQVWQSFVVLFPLRNIIAVRCIASADGMNVTWVRLPYEVLEKISRRIIGKIKGISRVVYDISSQPPSTVEWE